MKYQQAIFSLTSPPSEGQQVRSAQHLLTGSGYLPEDIELLDGVFDAATAAACRAAKLELGLHPKKCDATWTKQLEGLLRGTIKQSVAQRRRAAKREGLEADSSRRLAALGHAKEDIGMTENPAGSNICPISTRWGIRGKPWCGAAVGDWYRHAGSKRFVPPAAAKGRYPRVLYCPYIAADARGRRDGLRVVQKPRPGDIVLFDWRKDGTADHVGLFDKWLSEAAGTFFAVEGNTIETESDNDGSRKWQLDQSNGGGVFRKRRTLSVVSCFVSVSG